MSRFRIVGLKGCLLAIGLVACATAPMPPSEMTMSIVRSYQNQLEARVASGHLTRTQARELLYAKLGEIHPPLPDLGQLLEFRKQVTDQVEAKTLTPEQAETRLSARESEMLRNWEEMAARYAREQREIERLRGEYERGYRDQKQMEQTIKSLPR
jgi:hypothetical protein